MTMLLQQLEASPDKTGHRVMFLLMKYVQIQILLTCLVSGLISCQRLVKHPRARPLVRNLCTVIYTYFMTDVDGHCP